MPFVEVNLAAGRSSEQLRLLIHEVSLAVERSLGAPLASIRVVVREIPPALWAAGDVTLEEKAGGGL
jgi:4-oxalocrotonate tautomerase